MKDKLNNFLETFIVLFIILVIPLSLVWLVGFVIYELSESYDYKYVYQYEDLDGNIGISDNCTYYKDYGYLSQSDNQVCYIDGVKTLVKTIKIYGAKKCNIWDGICEAKIYTELDVLN